MHLKILLLVAMATLLACEPPKANPVQPPTWNPVTAEAEAEYEHYMQAGIHTVSGQAFLTQRDGGVVRGAGRNVELVPATSTGSEWWAKAGKVWRFRYLTPSSPRFHSTRRVTVADADGRFTFRNVPRGKYYIRTEVTWDVPGIGIQGGIVNAEIEVKDGPLEVILNHVR